MTKTLFVGFESAARSDWEEYLTAPPPLKTKSVAEQRAAQAEGLPLHPVGGLITAAAIVNSAGEQIFAQQLAADELAAAFVQCVQAAVGDASPAHLAMRPGLTAALVGFDIKDYMPIISLSDNRYRKTAGAPQYPDLTRLPPPLWRWSYGDECRFTLDPYEFILDAAARKDVPIALLCKFLGVEPQLQDAVGKAHTARNLCVADGLL